jgi:hypothetical protein
MKTNRLFYVVFVLITATVVLACSFATGILSDEKGSTPEPPFGDGGSDPLVNIVGTWEPVVVPGLTDSNITYLINYTKFGEYYYFAAGTGGTGKPETLTQPGAIWRTRDGTAWEMVGEPGIGDVRNWHLQVYTWHERLYVTTQKSDTFSLWVSENGETLNQIQGDWSEKGYPSLTVIDDKLFLFIDSHEEDGLQAWYSSDGMQFERVFEKGLDDPTNAGIIGFQSLDTISLKGWTYFGMWNLTKGGEIWRTKDGLKWEKSAVGGLGNPKNSSLAPQLVFNDYLYITVLPYVPNQYNAKGVEVFRTADGEQWEIVVEDGFGLGENQATWAWLMAYHDALYLLTTNNDPRGFSFTPTGFRLWKSLDGKAWQQVGDPGFGNPNNFMLGGNVIRDVFYLAPCNLKDGNQLWRSSDGENWELFFTAPPSETNQGSGLFEVGDSLIFSTNDPVEGIKIWRYGP